MKPTLFITALLLFLLAGCQVQTGRSITAPNIDTPEDTTSLQLPSRAQTLKIDSDLSRIDIFVFRGGRLAHLGHNHVITAQNLQGNIYVHPELSKTKLDLVIPVVKLIIDNDETRALSGKDFNKQVTPTEKAGTRKNLLGPKVLDASQHPLIIIKSSKVTGPISNLSADLAITIRGKTIINSVPITITKNEAKIHIRGQTQLFQSDFGIIPFSILGGAIAVQDKLTINFNIVVPNS